MKPLLTFVAFLTGYHYLFWQETLGINLFIFGLAIFIYSFFTRKIEKLSFSHFLLIGLMISGGIAVTIINTEFSKVMFFITLMSTHVSLQTDANSVLAFFGNSFINVFSFSQGLIPGWSVPQNRKRRAMALYMRIGIIPFLIFVIYFLLFSAGNSIFGNLTEGVLLDIAQFLTDLFSPFYFLFMVLGIIIIRWATRTKWYQVFRLSTKHYLKRKNFRRKPFKNLDLKYEYLMATILFALLNGLFFVVNVIDVKWVWFQFDINEVYSLKEFVHEGVGWLIFTLLISIGVILYYFRGNLNFYPKNKFLKSLAFAWIIQNAILAISVILRTLYYVQYHGIASKRIGVFLFLIMVLFGLATLFHKIQKGKNFAYILKVNSLFIVAVLSVASLFPWNIITAQINLNHQVLNQIDVDNYLDLDPQVYPLLYENLDKINEQIVNHQNNNERWIGYRNLNYFKEVLDRKAQHYLHRKEKTTIASWSWADQKAIAALEKRFSSNELP